MVHVMCLDTESVEDLFKELDKNRDNFLDRTEVTKGFQKLHLPCTPHILDELFERADFNQDGRVSLEEFGSYVKERVLELRRTFDQIDKNRDGRLDSGEIKYAIEGLGLDVRDQDVDMLIGKITKNENDELGFDEFRDFLLLLPSNSLRIIFDNWAKSASIDLGDGDFTIPDDIKGGKPEYLVNFLSGGAAGAVSRTMTAPMDRVKTLMQAGSDATKGKISIFQALKNIYRDGGVRAFFRGNGSNVIKIMPESAIKFVAYDQLKQMVVAEQDNIQLHERFLAGAGAGVLAQTVIYPLEIAKTRLAVSAKGEFSGIFDCLHKIIKKDGPFAIYRGLGPSILGIAPFAGIDLSIFNTLKHYWISTHPGATDGPGNIELLCMGATSSCTGAVATYPLQLVRTRLQTQGMNSNMPVKYNGMLDCFRRIVSTDGVRGLYRGLAPNLLKALPSVSISYVVYENTKKVLS
uniref:EF-hand domain-containing protein n=1 Tax=Mucochytrium quahogii TaxID=96639 RepID=A0A7S2WI82_9STRA